MGPEINSQLLQMMTKIPPPSVTSVFATVVPELSHGDVVLAISQNGWSCLWLQVSIRQINKLPSDLAGTIFPSRTPSMQPDIQIYQEFVSTSFDFGQANIPEHLTEGPEIEWTFQYQPTAQASSREGRCSGPQRWNVVLNPCRGAVDNGSNLG